MIPLMGSELAKARMQDYHRAAQQARLAGEAHRARLAGAARGHRARSGRSGRWRLTLGARLVSAGLRLIGETVEPGMDPLAEPPRPSASIGP
ncbi:MAG: hypothetical protein HYU54_08710 [Actinobacteria bacterium]|nr:hypothetical protein [Actinomycetota bacterium]